MSAADIPQITYPKLPGFAFSTGVCAPLAATGPAMTQFFSVSADGTLWQVTGTDVLVFDYASGAFTTVYTPASGSIQAIGAASVQLAYLVLQDGGTSIVSLDDQGDTTSVAALPGGAVPASIDASPDGAVWVLDTGGAAWSLAAGSWQGCSTAGTQDLTFASVSVGAAGFVLGLANQSAGGTAPMTWDSQNGWTSLSTVPQSVTWLAACQDGSTWYIDETGDYLTVIPPSDPQKTIDVSAVNGSICWGAASQMICYTYQFDDAQFGMFQVIPIAYGILDLDPVPFPAMTSDQVTAYDYIGTQLNITVIGGVRSEYVNTAAILNGYQTDVSTMPAPTGVSAADWTIVSSQIYHELQLASAIAGLFDGLNAVQSSIATMQGDQLTYIQTLVDPNSVSNQQSEVSLIFSDLVSAILTKSGSLLPPPYSFFATLLGTAINAAYTYSQNNTSPPSPDGAVTCEYGELSAAITTNSTQIGLAQAAQQTTIVSDWGKLCATGLACGSFLASPPDAKTLAVADLAPAWDAMYYQALMPVAWQILQALVIDPDQPPFPASPQSPGYSQMTKSETVSGGAMIWYYICCEIGSTTDVGTNDGPWPSADLLNGIFALGSAPSDFFGGGNGWAIPVATASTWVAPPASLAWDPYQASSS